jgi:hypothetical protein
MVSKIAAVWMTSAGSGFCSAEENPDYPADLPDLSPSVGCRSLSAESSYLHFMSGPYNDLREALRASTSLRISPNCSNHTGCVCVSTGAAAGPRSARSTTTTGRP